MAQETTSSVRPGRANHKARTARSSTGRFALLPILIAVSGAAGCQSDWRPPANMVQAPASAERISLADYGPPAASVRTYRRTDLKREDRRPDQYEVRTTPLLRQEGALILSTGPLPTYIAQGDEEEPDQFFPWPKAKETTDVGFFLEFDPPLVYCPRDLDENHAAECESKLTAYNWAGKRIYDGKVARTFQLEGHESVSVDETEYPDCIRLRIETRIRIPWFARVDMAEYVWLARDVGQVRLVRRWKGVVLLSLFEDVAQYELIGMKSTETAPADSRNGIKPLEEWLRCAIYLRPALPSPWLEGLIVEKP